MEIQSSAFNAGVQGFQQATEDADKAARNIAQRNDADRQVQEQQQVQQSQQGNAARSAESAPVEQPPALTESIVSLKLAEVQGRTSAEVIRTADEVLGTLIDTTA